MLTKSISAVSLLFSSSRSLPFPFSLSFFFPSSPLSFIHSFRSCVTVLDIRTLLVAFANFCLSLLSFTPLSFFIVSALYTSHHVQSFFTYTSYQQRALFTVENYFLSIYPRRPFSYLSPALHLDLIQVISLSIPAISVVAEIPSETNLSANYEHKTTYQQTS